MFEKSKKRNQKGFTLIELSIVIVIIGLIVAGIFGGQELIRQAQLRTIIAEQTAVKTAVAAFRLEYDQLPGDMPNARAYWAGCGDTDAECNGDGNKRVSIAAIDSADNEAYRFWEHLAEANLYPGAYTGEAIGTAFNGGNGGTNIPSSKFPATSITYANVIGPGGVETNDHRIIFGADIANAISEGDILTPPQALALDEKIDDSNPSVGSFRSASTSAVCIDDNGTAANFDDDTYDLTVAVPTCFIEIRH